MWVVINFRAKWKIAQLGNFPLLCRDNLLFVAKVVTCRGTSHPQAASYCVSIKMSRPHHSFEGIALVAT